MGREIEMKVPVSKAEFVELYKIFTEQKKHEKVSIKEKAFVFKQDEYYSRFDTREERSQNDEPRVIRIRIEKEAECFEDKIRLFSDKNISSKSSALSPDTVKENTAFIESEIEFNKIVSFIEQLKSETSVKQNAVFGIKFKTVENGIEFNSEHETVVEDADVLRKFFASTGFNRYFNKEKNSFGFMCCLDEAPQILFHAELEIVNGFPYLETECTQNETESEKVSTLLEKFFIELGLDPSRKDSRSWMSIIQG